MKINKSYSLKIVFIILGAIFSLYSIFNIGLSYDQIFHIENGEKRLKYLFSFGRYDYYDILHLKYYPGLYDTISVLLATAFPRNLYYESFYLINFLTGLAGLFGLKKVVSFFFGSKVSKIFFLISFFSPIFFGHLPINPKDTIIATANFWILYYVIKYLKTDSNIIRNDVSIKIGFFLGLGVGVRVLFLGTLIPIIFFFFFEIFFFKKIVNKLNIKVFLKHLIYIFLISYFFLILCWPNVHSNIFTEPFRIFFQSLKDTSQGVQLSYFAGNFYDTLHTPWYYIFLNLFYKIPVFYLIIFFFSFIFIMNIKTYFKKNTNFIYYISICLFLFFFPILIAIFFKLKIHDGLRYFIYLIPLFNIIPSIFLLFLFEGSKNLKFFSSIILLPFLFIFLFKFFSIAPYHYSYLNIFNDIFLVKDSFENDYWGSSSKELIKKFSKKVNNNKFLKIAICGVNPVNVKYYLKKNGIKNFNLVDLNNEFDYAILINRAIFKDQTDQNQTCYSKFSNKKVYISVRKSFIDLSKIVEY
ncbi:hypothetical protein IDH20_01135 [Pelagibacterales bacterium SAG-MED39]|nr:hypothetical protein [Pelagibacterales bacterium SAG-MED39]